MHSVPFYHGAFGALATIVPAGLVLLVLLFVQTPVVERVFAATLDPAALGAVDTPDDLLLTELSNIASGQVFGDPSAAKREAAARLERYRGLSTTIIAGTTVGVGLAGLGFSLRRLRPEFRARNEVERIVHVLLALCAIVAIVTTAAVLASILGEAIRFFARVTWTEFLFGTSWDPSGAIRADQAVGAGSFGLVPVLAGTLLITAVALGFGVPVGLLIAIHLAEFAKPRVRAVAKPILEILSGIPTVVYGFFAALTVAPFVADTAGRLGLEASEQSALAAGLVMGIMIIPFVSSLSEDVISGVSSNLRTAALSLGATHGETVRRVVIPAALPGIVGAVVLAFSVAVGETMIVLMAAGLFANLTANPLEPVTTMTVQIANILTGDQPFDSATTLSAFALALVLFVLTLAANLVALQLTARYREV